MWKKILILAIAVVVILTVPAMLIPAPTEEIENPDYVDPGVLEGTELTQDIPNLGDPILIDDCDSHESEYNRDRCLLYQSENANSIELCRGISDVATKNICIRNLATINANTSYCSYMVSVYTPEDNSNVKNACITAVAKEEGEENICEQILDSEWREHCKNIVRESIPF
ncbi:MAG: hypothetical protein JW772_00740 [Candidatus Diapherotrites archaeon]|nr:hypothetical protein [Candidatus Diapherotrites archaeon]